MSAAEEKPTLDTSDQEASNIDVVSDSEAHYVTGFKLALVVASVALACFLMLLDTMVISTVCNTYPL